ncbi:MAG TPA: DoxX-like family protein, partial [Lysobacter sp.]|nr:DoxX-like family protein [Lysobacter sp.]
FLVTAALSFGLYPVERSYALLADAGLHGDMATLALYAGAALDLVLGIAMLLPMRRGAAYLAAIALILGYTAIISLVLPAFWLHPFGPVLKNLPILTALVLLHALDRRP